MAIKFDDSIIEDKEAESVRASREVSQGLISKAEYREKIFGETEEAAKKAIEEIEDSTPSINKLLNDDDKEQEEKNEEQKEDKEKSKDKDKDNKKK